MEYTVTNGMANIHTIYAIDDVNNGIDSGYISRDKCIEGIINKYNKDILPYVKDCTRSDGSLYTAAEQIYDDMACLKENGYIEDAYYILTINLY